MLDEELSNIRVAALCCRPHCRIVTSVDIRAVLDEELHHSCVAIL